jgi:hypothetical protein
MSSPFGIEVYAIESKYLPKEHKFVQSRYPKSRKRRIREKFRKKYGRWIEMPNDKLYFIDKSAMQLDFKPDWTKRCGVIEP